MNSKYPLVSIGMPVFNCEETLIPAVRSILTQTYQNWELLLIDDGSTDCTPEIVRSFHDKRIHIVYDDIRRGLVSRLNQAISLSYGQYFARMDGDDIAYPERLERQVKYLEEHPEIDLIGTEMIVFGENGRLIGKRSCTETHEEICRRPIAGFRLFHPTYMGRLDWFQRYRYDARAIRCEDQDLLLRAYRNCRFANISEVLLGYREGTLQLRKILKGRWFFVQAVTKQFSGKQRFAFSLMAMVEHSLKAAFEIFAISTGLNHRLLRHRAQAVTEAERSQWESVWNLVNQTEVFRS